MPLAKLTATTAAEAAWTHCEQETEIDISVQTTTFESPERTHRFKGGRPDHLPIAAAEWDVADRYGKGSEAAVVALYEAVKRLDNERNGSTAIEPLRLTDQSCVHRALAWWRNF
jgi:hypothetical protein